MAQKAEPSDVEESKQKEVVEDNKMIKRQLGAVMGVLVADAGSLPLHWVFKSPLSPLLMLSTIITLPECLIKIQYFLGKKVYKDNRMDKAIFQKTHDKTWKLADFAFLNKNYNPFYNLPVGRNSNYSDQLYVTLQSIHENKGFDSAKWKQALYTAFGGKDNVYQTSRKLRDEVYSLFDYFGKWKTPVDGPWLHVAMIDFCQKYEAKEEDTSSRHEDNDGLANAIPIVTYLASNNSEEGFPEEVIRGAIGSIISTPAIVLRSTFICKLLWEIITKGNIKTKKDFANLMYVEREAFLTLDGVERDDLMETVYKEVCSVMDHAGFIVNDQGNIEYDASKRKFKTQREAVMSKKLGYGKPCRNPGSFKGPLHNVLINGDDYKKAVLNEIESGGDNCSRLHITGSVIGAMHGVDCIPKKWMEKTLVAENALKICNEVF